MADMEVAPAATRATTKIASPKPITSSVALAGGLAIPELDDDASTLDWALAYARVGWYIVPVKCGSKHPGSVVGDKWQDKSSRDPQQLVAWFAGTDHGLALHLGRSGAVAFDVDDALQMPPALAATLDQTSSPMQRTRDDDEQRGHYVFALPPGHMPGNGTGSLGDAWGDVRGRNGVIIVQPSVHDLADDGGCYAWARTGVLPVLPPELDAALGEASGTVDAVTDAEVTAFLAQHTAACSPYWLDTKLRSLQTKLAAGGSRHDALVAFTTGAMEEARAGYYAAQLAADRLCEAFVAAMATTRRGSDRKLEPPAARTEFAGMLAWAIGKANVAELDAVRERIEKAKGDPEPLVASNTSSTAPSNTSDAAPSNTEPAEIVTAYLGHLATWQDGDLSHALFGLAVAVSASADGEPLWGQIIGSPSSGKTEVIRSLDDIASDRVDELTAPAMMSWSSGRNPHPIGILIRLGNDPAAALLTVGDFSTVLAGSDKSARDREQLFSLLRRIYDGAAHRDVGVHGQIRWRGRLSILAACTPAIDDFASHTDALGPRWVYFRVPEIEKKQRRSSRSRRGDDLKAKRTQARKLAGEAVRAGRARLPEIELTDELLDLIDDVAEIVRRARGAVPRDGYGRRDIVGLPIIEEPYRLIAQLQQLARALLGLGLGMDAVTWMTIKAALDTVPRARLAVLQVLAAGNVCNVAELARAARIPVRRAARFAAEELRVTGLACCPVEDGADVDDESEVTTRRDWQLIGGDLGELTAAVLRDQHHREVNRR